MDDQRGPNDQPWLSAAAAAARLGVQRRTLYAYVARGLLRSVPGAGGRRRRYARDDVERLLARHRARAGHGAVAAAALRWGDPVLETAITAIDGARGPIYRGRAAVDLVRTGVGFEATAELLWGGALPAAAPAWPRQAWQPAALARLLPPAGVPPAAQLAFVVAALGVGDADRHDPRPAAARQRARALLPLLAAACAPGLVPARVAAASAGATVATVVARAAGSGRGASAEVVRAVDAALVLMADHELNASAFAARVAASTGADLHACLLAALATLSGPRHGAMAERVAAIVDETGSARRAAATLRARRQRGEELVGFGHPLYPAGDPRATLLLELARAFGGTRPRVRTCLALAAAGVEVAGAAANCDLGLVALADAARLRPGGASALFAVGRAAGWVAHVLEQRDAGFLIRPRARVPAPV